MRKTILLLCACLCCTVAVLAQNVQGVRQGKERTCILDDELKYIKDCNILTSAQYADFDKSYREYHAKKSEIKHEIRNLRRQTRDKDLSDEELLLLINKIDSNQMALAVLNQSYHYKYLEIMSAKQYVQINKARRDFKRAALEKLKSSKK